MYICTYICMYIYIYRRREKFERIDITMVIVPTFGWWDLVYHYYFCTYKRNESFLKKCKGHSWGTLGDPWGTYCWLLWKKWKCWSFSHVRLCDPRLLCPWNSPPGDLPDLGINPALWQTLYHLSHQGSPSIYSQPPCLKVPTSTRLEKEYFPSIPCNDEWPCDTIPVIR